MVAADKAGYVLPRKQKQNPATLEPYLVPPHLQEALTTVGPQILNS